MDKNELKNLVLNLLDKAIRQVYATDKDVITNKVSERCVCARLAFHLENIIRVCDNQDLFKAYYVDVEYDRMVDANPKHIVGGKKHVCDLLIHSRGHITEQDNLLALEMKVHDNYSNVDCDKCRLKHIVQHSNETNMGYVRDTLIGVFLRLQEKQYKFMVFDGDINNGEPLEEKVIPV